MSSSNVVFKQGKIKIESSERRKKKKKTDLTLDRVRTRFQTAGLQM